MNKIICFVIIGLLIPELLFAQMERKRTVTDRPVEDIFMGESIVGLSTVTLLPKRNLSSSVRHNFGLVSGGIDDFFGLDVGATVRLGVNYGITDKLTIGIGRSSLENTIDLNLRYALLEQMKSGKTPLKIVIKTASGINTQRENRFNFTFTERLNYMASVIIARKFNERFSLQLSPMLSHFNTVIRETEGPEQKHTHFGVGMAGRFKLNTANAVAIEYLPVIGRRNAGTTNHIAIAYEIDTGGHVFQIFFMTGQWFTEQHLLTRTSSSVQDWDFRLGFNINRLFSL